MKSIVTQSVVLILLSGIFSSCDKNFVEPKPAGPEGSTGTTGTTGPTATVFFAADIEPVFSSNCKSCHNANSASYPYLNLSSGNSYTALISNPNGKTYVDTITPASSLIYTKIATGGSMYGYATDTLRTKILTWIQEGYKNN